MKNAIILLLITIVIMNSGCGGSDVSQTVVQNGDKGTFKVHVNIPDPSILGKVIPLNSRYLRVTVTHSSGTSVSSDFVDLTTSSQVVLNNISTGINIATLEIWDSTKTILMAIRKYSFFMGAGQTASPPNNLMMGMGIDPNAEVIPRTVTFYLSNGTNRVYLENYDDIPHDITIQTSPPQTVHLNAVVPPDEANSIPVVFDGTSFYFNSPGTYNIYMDGSQTSSSQIIVLTQGGGGGGGTPPSTNLNSIFVSEASYVWAVGDNGRILRSGELLSANNLSYSNAKKNSFPIKSDTQWTLETSPTTQKLNGVASYYIVDEANNRVFFKSWAIGNNGTILYYYAPISVNNKFNVFDYQKPVRSAPEPNSWSVVNIYTTQNLNGICFYADCSCSSVEGWAVGNNGTILHYTEENNININATSKSYSGGWTLVPLNLNSLNVKNNKNNFLKNSQSNKDWELTPTPAPSGNVNLNSVCYDENNNKEGNVEYWAVGDGGTILHYYENTWSIDSSGDFPINNINLKSVSFVSGDGWAVGTDTTNNTGVILHYYNKDGLGWYNITSEVLSALVLTELPPLKGVYVDNDNNPIVWFVGNNGEIYYYSEETWYKGSSEPTTTNNLNAIHGGGCDCTIFSVGDANTIVEVNQVY